MNFTKFILKNGLTTIFHHDKNSALASINLIYDAGSKDENIEKTGTAHFLEHMMFEGSKNIQHFDKILENVGATNNAYTTKDYTNYYISVPKNNIETALWVEADRMTNLNFDHDKFITQKNVIIEEFKQTTLNEPYGDDIDIIYKLAYKKHPYRFSIIGDKISHIENTTINQLKNFYAKFYTPANSILTIGGNFEFQYIKEIVQKWFGDIPKTTKIIRKLPEEPPQTKQRRFTVKKNVPFDNIYMAFHFGKRTSEDFYILNMITDILDDGKSARLYQKLIKENKIFDYVEAGVYDCIDYGLVIISGKPAKTISLQKAEDAIWQQIEKLKNEQVTENEIQKSLNNLDFRLSFEKTNTMQKINRLGFYELIGNLNIINNEKKIYFSITPEDIQNITKKIFTQKNVSVLHYLSK